MKTRIILIAIVMCLSFVAHAQVDTVAEFDPHYLYQYPEDSLMPWYDSDTCNRHLGPYWFADGSIKEIAAAFYYPGAYQIYGLAVMIQTYRLEYYSSSQQQLDFGMQDTMYWNEQLKLYSGKDRTHPLATGTIRLGDCSRYMRYYGCHNTLYVDQEDTTYYRLLQINFDSAITVEDSFITSITTVYFADRWNIHELITEVFKLGCIGIDSTCVYPDNTFWLIDTNDVWHEEVWPRVMQIFPIIDLPGDTCPAVSNVHITGAYGSLVMAEWETATNNSRWEVSYGPVGTEPDSGTIITCMEPVAKMLNLNVDSQYVAYVRPVCRFGITKRGEWSEGVVFNPLSGEVGIEQVADTEPLTLYPNPTSGTVRIGLPEGQHGVDVRLYDMAGREVMRSTSLTLDVSHLPHGTYTVRAATAMGTRSGRLVVTE